MNHDHHNHEQHGHAQNVTDPVCGMSIPPAPAELRSQHHGGTYHFCSTGCKKTFDADPGKYAHGAGHSHH